MPIAVGAKAFGAPCDAFGSRPSLMLVGRLFGSLCLAALVGCNGGAEPSVGNTELNVVIPNNGGQSPAPDGTPQPAAFDIQVVEYTIACNDGADNGPFLDNNASFADDVTISGVLEVLDTASGGVSNQDFGPDLSEVYVWQGFMDLPPTAGCTVQLRARDGDGEVICSATETFDIAADSVTKVNVLMYCGISFQAPVGMLDLDGDFSFNVANFCPDLFVLNCIDSELDVRTIPPVGDVLATACQVRFRDGDSQCGTSCDPQTCNPTPTGLSCTPGPDPGVSTTVTCASTLGACAISCDGLNPAASCTFSGDTLGNIGDPPPGALAPGVGGFFVSCATVDDDGDPNTPNVPATPGDSITCTAVTTDGDVDCDKTKEVALTIVGDDGCLGDDCDDGNDCTTDFCDLSSGTPGPPLCVNNPIPDGTPCAAGVGACQSGVCNTAGTIPAGSSSTTWSANTTPPGSNGGPTATGGGATVFVTALNSTIELQVDITLTVTSDGNNNFTTDWTVELQNFLLPTVGDAAELGALSIGAVVTGGTPSFIPSTFTPAATGQPISAFLNGDTLTLSSPGQVTRGSATITPTGPSVRVNWDGNFSIELTLGGNPLLTIDQDTTEFDVIGGDINFGFGDSPCNPTASPPPPAACFDDGNECTVDSCDDSSGAAVCVNAPLANGTACSTAPTATGAGSCQNGACLEVPIIPAGSGTTTWVANTIPFGSTGGPTATSGGCAVDPTVIGTTIYFDTTVVLGVTSDGNNNFATDWTVSLQQFLLPTLSNAAEYGSLSLNAIVTGGVPSSIPSTANAAATGQLIGAFVTGGLLTLGTPSEITQGVAAVTPGAPGLRVNWDGKFDLQLTLGGNPLLEFNQDACLFNVQGSGVSFGDLPCSPTATPPPPPDCFDDGNDCTVDSCDDSSGSAVCVNAPAADGTACSSAASLSGLGECQAGACVPAGCTIDGCSAGTECRLPQTCNPSTEQCEPVPPDNQPDGTACNGGNGACQSGSCIDNCLGIVCDDGNDCTADPPCDSAAGGICPASSFEPAGTFCNPGTGPFGECDGAGVCIEVAAPVVAAGSGQTVWQARTTPLGSSGGPSATGAGCAVFVTVLNTVLPLDVTLTLGVSSDGSNNISTAWTAEVQHFLLPSAGNAAEYGGIDIRAQVSNGTPSAIPSSANPAALGQLIGAFLVGDVFILTTPTEISEGSARIVPTGSSINVNWDGTFTVELTLGGTPLVTVDESVCTFDVQGSGVDFAVNQP